jgi:hypothetical protein
VVDYSADQVSVDEVRVSDGEPALDAYDTPESRMHLLLSGRSIALVKNTGRDSYRTAAGAIIHVKAPSAPSGLLMEWRVDGTPALVGAEGDLTLSQVAGRHFVAVGPPQKPHTIRVDTYQTKIVVEGSDHIAPGGPTRFRVTTNPPGFEQDVRWMAGTMFGAADPAVGQGATFEAVFDRTWPTNAEGIVCYGVRAGNAALIVEQPPPFEGDMIRLRDDLGNLGDAMGSHACCISDSTARQNYYHALNELVKAKSKMSILVTTFDGLPKLVRLAIQVGYGDLHAQMASNLAQLESSIAQLNAEPPCGSDALITGFVQRRTFCSSLCAIAAVMASLGALLLVVGGVISAVAPEAVIGEILLIVGGILLGVGVIILLIVGPSGFNCC